MEAIGIIYAPFTDEQVKNLHHWQTKGWGHPFTCCAHVTMTVDREGFHCPQCQHLQTWCHDFMAEPPNEQNPS